jgi:hypothetical protein
VHPKLDKQFELEVDASGYAVGAVLLQKKEDSKKHLIAYFSKTLNEAQRNYNIADLELLVVVMSLDNWRSFLAGSPHKVIVYSDHQNLLYWKELHKISRRELLELQPPPWTVFSHTRAGMFFKSIVNTRLHILLNHGKTTQIKIIYLLDSSL